MKRGRAEAHCDCTGRAPWPAMMRLHGGAPNRYYLCRRCGAVREDVYRGGAIVRHRWHDGQDGALPQPVVQEAGEVLALREADQLRLWTEEPDEGRSNRTP